MTQIIKDNTTYFIGYLIFLIIGGFILFNIEYGDAILYFSENRYPQADLFFRYFTKLGEEPTYIALIIFFLFVRFRYSLLVFITGILSIIVAYFAKMYFGHDRPISYFKKMGMLDQIDLVDGVNLYAGPTSFPSGHTISAFMLFGLFALLFHRKKIFGLLFLLIAIGVAISRIYLVQHFMQDIYTGSIIGTIFAIIIYKAHLAIPYNPNHWRDRSLVNLKMRPKRV